MKSRRRDPRSGFRVAAQPGPRGSATVNHAYDNGFDELVIGKWFHIERMSANSWWLRLGQAEADVTVDKRGEARTFWRDAGEGELIDAAQEGMTRAKK